MRYTITLLLAFLFSCSSRQEKQDYMALSVIVDSSDFHLLRLNAESIVALLNLKDHRGEGSSFRYSMISDKVLSPVTILRLPNADEDRTKSTHSNLSYRAAKVAAYYNDIRSIMIQTVPDSSKLKKSQCFRAITRELHALVRAKSKQKILLNFSNNYENSDLISIYSKTGKELLEKHPDKIMSIFEDAKLLPNDLSGIKVIFLYSPFSIDDDKKYNSIIAIYKTMLEKRHATVLVQVTNEINEL